MTANPFPLGLRGFFYISWVSFCCASLLELQLYQKLLNKSNKLVRPVTKASDAVQVTIGLYLQQIAFLDDRNQIIGINAWLQYRWNDYRLVWNSSEYKQIDSIRFGSNMIWHPDILLYNSGDENFDSTYKSQILVYSNGDVIWIPPGTFRTSCRIDITWFPFDDQSCYLKFGSWTYNGLALNLKVDTKEGKELNRLIRLHFQWRMDNQKSVYPSENTRAKREEIYYSCCPDPYYSVKFFLSIRRRTLYYGFNIIIPSLLIATLTTLAFTLPPIDLSEKIGFQTTVISSMCFFLIYVSQITPLTSEAVSLLGMFFSITTLLVASSTTFTIAILNIRYRLPENYRVKSSVCVIFLNSMSKILRMERMDCGSKMIFIENKKFKQQASRSPILQLERCKALKHALLKAEFESDCLTILASKMPEIPASHLFISEKIGERLSTDSQHLKIEQKKAVTHEKLIKLCMEKLANPENEEYNERELVVTRYYAAMYSRLEYISERIKKRKTKKDERDYWKFAAVVLDRCCLLVFSVLIITTIIGIFVFAPHFHE